MRSKVWLAVSLLLVVTGLIMWYTRPAFVRAEFPQHGDTFDSSGEPVDIGDRGDLCSSLQGEDGYLLISGNISLATTGVSQGFLQTSDGETGLFFEYDPGEDSLLRFGFHQSDENVARVKYRNLRKSGAFNFSILVQSDGTLRMVGDGTDETSKVENLSIDCSNFRIAAANGSEGIEGTMSVSFSSGLDAQQAEELIDSYLSMYSKSLPSTLYKWPLYAGVLLLVIGNPWAWRKK
jgi:hypothetical protein